MAHEHLTSAATATGRLAYARMSRRQFVSRSALAVGGLAGLELLRPPLGFSASGTDPNPIPGGLSFALGEVPKDPDFHVFLPYFGKEVSTITDFSGFVAAAEIQGTATGGGSTFSFDADMRLMQGRYIGKDGRAHEGRFGFIWIDLFTGPVEAGDQKHDFEPGIAPDGLFWTIAVPASAGEVAGLSGNARFHMENLAIPDFTTFFNALSPTPDPPPIASHATFDVHWQATGERKSVRDETFGFAGDFFESEATISFVVSNDKGATYTSVEAGQKTLGSAVGRERNGVYFA